VNVQQVEQDYGTFHRLTGNGCEGAPVPGVIDAQSFGAIIFIRKRFLSAGNISIKPKFISLRSPRRPIERRSPYGLGSIYLKKGRIVSEGEL